MQKEDAYSSAATATSPPRISAPRRAPVCCGAKADELLVETAAVEAEPRALETEAEADDDTAAPLDAAVVSAPPVPVALVLAPVDRAVAPVVQLTAVGTWTPWAEQICWAYSTALAWSSSEQTPTRQQATVERKLSLAQMHLASVPQPA